MWSHIVSTMKAHDLLKLAWWWSQGWPKHVAIELVALNCVNFNVNCCVWRKYIYKLSFLLIIIAAQQQVAIEKEEHWSQGFEAV